MNVFRSAPIRRYSTLVPHQLAFDTISQLISLGYIQMELAPTEDPSSIFATILSRIRASRLKLQKIAGIIQDQFGHSLAELSKQQKNQHIVRLRLKLRETNEDFLKYLDRKEENIDRDFRHIEELSANYEKIKAMLQGNRDEERIAQGKLEVYRVREREFQQERVYDAGREFTMITGVCAMQSKAVIQKLVFRASRGHSYVVFKDDDDIHDQQRLAETANSAVFIFMPGTSSSLLYQKIQKICNCNNVTLYQLPNQTNNLLLYQKQLRQKRVDIQALLEVSEQGLLNAITNYTQPQREPRILKLLTRLRYLERIAFILCHQIPTTPTHFLLSYFKPAAEPDPPGLIVYEADLPNAYRTCMPRVPCLFQANILTTVFAVPRHDQVIPSLFISITLPILFGMMFSDVGHGLLLLLTAKVFGLGRIWLVVGFMSIYFGALFNQFFGMKVPLFYWISGGRFGVNPIWGIAQNSLSFENSLKMKLSIIIGTIHMVFGSVLKLVNDRYQKKHLTLYFQSLPKLLLMLCTVGYLAYLIVLKWTIDFAGKTATAPSVISMTLDMYLGYRSTRNTSLFKSMDQEKAVASILKSISLVCLASIMFGKAIYHKFQNIGITSKKYSQLQDQDQEGADQLKSQSNHPQEEEQEHFGPLQGFEYVLSLISSITSYLRLFALSLSHQKLSHLLLSFLIAPLNGPHPSFSIFRSMVFFIVTVLMMLLLDVMECLMHVIRLHWVEWMGKFFKGGGREFVPEIQGEH